MKKRERVVNGGEERERSGGEERETDGDEEEVGEIRGIARVFEGQ